MRIKICLIILLGVFVLLFNISFLQAFSDWWGTVTINENNNTDGAVVSAYINNIKVASSTVGQYTSGYYLVHIGGHEGEIIVFKINGKEAVTESWSNGDHELDLMINVSIEESSSPHTTLSLKQFCEPSWRCGGWSSCDDGMMTRTCYDASHCDYSYNEPNEVAGCGISEYALVDGEDNQIYVVAFLGVLSVVSLIVLVSVLSKK